MATKDYRSLYHLHIAKCGGTYLSNVLITPLIDEFRFLGIQCLDGIDHLGWQDFPNKYVISSLRDPVKRTVSHYAYWRSGAGVNGRKPENPLEFFDWIEAHSSFIANYQMKNLLFSRVNFDYDIFQPSGSLDPAFASIQIDKVLLLTRLSSINILLKDTQLNSDFLDLVHKQIKKDFSIESASTITTNKDHDNKVMRESYELYQTLTAKQKEYLYELNDIDSEIYFSNDFYFNKGYVSIEK